MSHARSAHRMAARGGAILTLVAAALLSLIAAPAANAAIQAAPTAAAVSTVTLTGHGNGHGRGLLHFFTLPFNLTFHTADFSGAGGFESALEHGRLQHR